MKPLWTAVMLLAIVSLPTIALAQPSPPPIVMVHYMPWYQSKPYGGSWGWHWTMNHYNPDTFDGQGRRKIASHYYPLVGPYDSRDPDLVEYTWCGPCIGELPNLKKAYETYRERGFEIVGVSLDDDDRETFVAWLEKNEVPWPQIYDGKGWETPMGRKFGVQGIPFQILLDAEGNVLEGDLRGERVSEALAETLGAAEATPSSSAASPTPVPASPGGR